MTRPTQTDECIDHGCCSGVTQPTISRILQGHRYKEVAEH